MKIKFFMSSQSFHKVIWDVVGICHRTRPTLGPQFIGQSAKTPQTADCGNL